MLAKAKNNNMFCPTWVQGMYITYPPVRPKDNVQRPKGHYIDEGGYPGADVCEIIIETLCLYTGNVDCKKCRIFENDILLYETEQEIGYFIVDDTKRVIDIINGEILDIAELQSKDIKVIGNILDYPDFIEGIRYCVDTEREIPYLPVLNVVETPYPFFKMTCLKCGHVMFCCAYTARHEECGGFWAADFATKVYRQGEQKEKAFA